MIAMVAANAPMADRWVNLTVVVAISERVMVVSNCLAVPNRNAGHSRLAGTFGSAMVELSMS
ncbi:hypothetical protein MTX26_06520 [Bradyrhizobium sp. ISRA443]|uniref:hypothetical protein n=1 Tax=Bradyrhizobium sp. ISRA443 TaxID=2866198 RepID=UPI002479F76D|nr:hypothetical protein [Bradyrhizobium sp. ISRA443]WGR95466.1 hypothetical protein MTX20_16765 [Bradyrhizobium sp. ISRA435]WGS14267.1 hypothetical protein MTX26_06520 [Bradyrhizobium sp. ISRA443]